MTLTIVTITALLLVLAALLLNLNLYTAWSWRIKATAVVVSFTTLAAVYHMLWQLLGWPVREPLPGDLAVLAIEVQEPSKGSAESGAVYLWARPAADPQAPPRAYELPYTQALHESASRAQRRLRDGRAQGARRGPASDSATGGGRSPPVFYDLTKPALPEKR